MDPHAVIGACAICGGNMVCCPCRGEDQINWALKFISKKLEYRSPLRYPGAKQKALKHIAPLLPKHVREYREPFLGGASVFLHAKANRMAASYWVNDVYLLLWNFWNVAQHPIRNFKLAQWCDWAIGHLPTVEDRKEFFLELREDKQTSCLNIRDNVSEDVFQALRFFIMNRMSFSGATEAGGFSSDAAMNRFTSSCVERLRIMPEAWQEVFLTCQDFEPLVKRDGEDVFLFIDPPYVKADKLYGKNGQHHDHEVHHRLLELLKTTKHRFLLTYGDCEWVRENYAWANIHEQELQYGMVKADGEGKRRKGAELFITNY